MKTRYLFLVSAFCFFFMSDVFAQEVKPGGSTVITGNSGKTGKPQASPKKPNKPQVAPKTTTTTTPQVLPVCTLEVCAMYAMTAKPKIAWKCGLKKYRGNCGCVKTNRTCGKNWRGAHKYIFSCACRPLCKQTICAKYTKVASYKSAYKCGWKKGYKAGNCKCERTTTCGKNWRGAYKYNFACKCK